MVNRLFIISFLTLVFLLQGALTWADDDSIMDVDNHNAGFSGSWGTSTAKILYYGDDYRYAVGAGSSVSTPTRLATFTTREYADITGKYHVYVRWTTHPNRETSAVYRIYSSNAPTTQIGSCSVNQSINGGEWRFCAEVTLTAGYQGIVTLGNEYTPTDKVVVADAVRFVRKSIDTNDITDLRLAGVDRGSATLKGNYNIASLGTSTFTNLRYGTISAPSGGTGYVIAQASGWAAPEVADESVHICIDDASAGTTCDSYEHYIENNTDEIASGAYENRKEFHIQQVYSITGGTSQTYYLKAARESTSATGYIYYDDFVLLYVPLSR